MTVREYNKRVLRKILPLVSMPNPFLYPSGCSAPEVSIYTVFDTLRELSGETEEEFNKFLDEIENEEPCRN